MSEINYSIIIPHKNIPNLLQRCLASIPRREDIQIIIVDDKSDVVEVDFECFPGVGEQCVEVYFTKEGKGAGYARNVGLKYAKGKWLLFVDSDDFFLKNFTVILDKYIDSFYDIVLFDVESRDVKTLENTSEGYKISSFLRSFDYTSKSNLMNLVFNHEVPWGKMIKRKFVFTNNIEFDEVIASNDTMFMLKSLFLAENITFCDEILYCWSIRSNSLVHTINRDILFARYEVELRRNRYCIDRRHKEYTHSIAYWLLQISKLGIKDFFKALNLCFKYRINPFTKCTNWIKHIS
jgi:glycosyltransferase involved in cell wall biosynthesis